MDLLQMPKARSGISHLLVAIDHNSKWVSVAPLASKTAAAVAGALRNKILPSLPRIPIRVLTDNGGEFSGGEVRELLSEYGIKQSFSTPYKLSSNGLVERVNRTILELLRGLSVLGGAWLDQIYKAITLYNNSYHSSIGKSPSAYLLTEAHATYPRPILPASDTDCWTQGNSSFSPFRPKQLVLKKVIFKGRQVADKLSEKFVGPCEVVLRHPNKVSYIIKDCETGFSQRAHHTQLRRFYAVPKYIKAHPSYMRIVEKEEIEPTTIEAVSYTHLTLPTKRIV